MYGKKFEKCLIKYTSEDIENEYNSKFKWFKGGRCDLKKTLFSEKKASISLLLILIAIEDKKDITYKNFLAVCAEYRENQRF